MALITKTSTALLLGCILICCTESTATAQDAEAIFKRCVERINKINDRVTNAQIQTLRECVPRIKRLIENGEIEEARHVAHRCIKKLDSLTKLGIEALRETCHPCLQRLRELQAYELAKRLANRCHRTALQLTTQNRRAKNFIKELF